jgi:bla regulator protein blaR1
MKKPLSGLLVVGVLSVVSAQAPTSPTFEVASIKQNRSGERSNFIRRLPGGRVTVSNMPVRTLLIYAYQLAPFQLVGGPGWLDDDRFDMVAKLEGNPEFGVPGGEPDPIRLAMRALLADRFKLTVNRETREMDIYALVMVKPGVPGPALKPVSPECAAAIKAGPRAAGPPPGPPPASHGLPCGGMGIGPGLIRFGGFPFSQVASILAGQSGRLVVDRTGLTGGWQFELRFAAEQRGQLPSGVDVPAPDADAPSFFTALQEQLGLKLEPTKGPVDVLVIEHVEHPSED